MCFVFVLCLCVLCVLCVCVCALFVCVRCVCASQCCYSVARPPCAQNRACEKFYSQLSECHTQLCSWKARCTPSEHAYHPLHSWNSPAVCSTCCISHLSIVLHGPCHLNHRATIVLHGSRLFTSPPGQPVSGGQPPSDDSHTHARTRMCVLICGSSI